MGEAELQAECKLELADILLMRGDPWEAILLYSQVEKDLKKILLDTKLNSEEQESPIFKENLTGLKRS